MLSRKRLLTVVVGCTLVGLVGVVVPAVVSAAVPAVTGSAGSLAIFAGQNRTLVPGPATSTPIGVSTVAVDSSGNRYITDPQDHVVEKVTLAGTLSIVAGVAGQSGAPTPGPATSSHLGYPIGVAVDGSGNLYVADGNLVEKVTPSGTLSIFAGVLGQGSGPPVPGPATSSYLNSPQGLAVDRFGNLYIADTGNDVVEKVTPSGTLSIIAGVVGQSGAPTPGPATSSDLDYPTGVAVDSSGNVYIADAANEVVEMVTPGGTLSIIAGIVGVNGAAPTPGPATSSHLSFPTGVAVDGSGNVYIADSGNTVVEKVTPSATLSIIAGIVGQSGAPTPGPGTSSDLGTPTGVAVDSSGNVYIADSSLFISLGVRTFQNDVVEMVTPSGTLSIIAGIVYHGAPTPGPATGSALEDPSDVAVDSSGDVYIADTENDVVEKVTPSGTLSIIAGRVDQPGAPTAGPATGSDLGGPSGVAVDNSGNVYIADSGDGVVGVDVVNNDVVEKVTPSGTLSIIAGVVGQSGAPTPGPATSSDLGRPSGVAVDSSGNMYIADSGFGFIPNGVVEKVTPSGTLSIFAGIVGSAGQPTPGPATSSELDAPAGVAVDGSGNLYIADSANDVVEKVTPSGTLSIIAGNGNFGAPTPGPATSSDLTAPSKVAVDGSGDVFIADVQNGVVEKVTPSGTLSIIAGVVGQSGAPTPGPATHSDLDGPAGVAVDGSGNLYIADSANSDVEEVFGVGSSLPAPTVVSYPSISGRPVVGQTLTESHGTWTGNPTSYTYEWKRCNTAVVCTTVSTARRYKLTAADVSDEMIVLETAENAAGSSIPASSDGTALVTFASPPPTNLSSPSISGQPIVGRRLTESHGTWTGNPTRYTHEWKHCTSTGKLKCTTISRARSYRVRSADLGYTILVLETAYNAAGASVPESSLATATVTRAGAAKPPANTRLPRIAGTAVVGHTLRELHGRWMRHGTRFTYRWYVCRRGGEACTVIAGATHRTYRLRVPLLGDEIRVKEIAYNHAGAGKAAISAPTRRVMRPAAAEKR